MVWEQRVVVFWVDQFVLLMGEQAFPDAGFHR